MNFQLKEKNILNTGAEKETDNSKAAVGMATSLGTSYGWLKEILSNVSR